MDHLAEVLKILDAAIVHDSNKAIDYANLLATKLDTEKQTRQAAAIRTRLKKSSVRSFAPASTSALPIDESTDLPTVDIQEWQEEALEELVLHPFVESKLQGFLSGVAEFDRWHAEGISTPNRLLLHGPPGTGKTSIARLIASRLDLPLLVSRSDILVSSLLGQTSKNIRTIFDFAQARPCVLFLDEFDALAKARTDSREIGELQRVVIALLQNIDAFPESSVLIAATNHPELLDTAAWRRFGDNIKIRLPGREERRRLWLSKLGQVKISENGLEMLVAYSDGLSAAAIQAAASDIRRHEFTAGGPLDLPAILRRLVRFVWEDQYEVFESSASEMRALRRWAPKIFTVRALADEFHVSTRQVSNAMRGPDDRVRTGTLPSLDVE